MPLAANGVFLKTADHTYEEEATYQLKYLIRSALISLDSKEEFYYGDGFNKQSSFK